MSHGWIKVHRSLMDHWVGQMEPYCAIAAWVDLLILANHKNKKVYINSHLFEVQRGQILTSIVKLSTRWNRGRKWISKLLNNFEKDAMIQQKRDNRFTLITICNYDRFQSKAVEEGTAEGTAEGQQNAHKQEDKERKEVKKKDLCRVGKKPPTSTNPIFIEQAKDLVKFFNKLTGRELRMVPVNLKPIIARLKEGVSEQQCRTLIARMHTEWENDPYMFKYLRPSTLFRPVNFENYLALCNLDKLE